MKPNAPNLPLGLLLLALLPTGLSAGPANEAILRATAAVQAATPRAQADPTRPIFHVASPAQFMNDPNGPIYYHGYYHLFYQLHPYSDASGPKYWGHVRSRDLVKWEPLPIALWPAAELGETEIWSGCCTLNGLGQPMCFYTSIGQGKSAFDQAVQCAAVGDDQLIQWQKSPANPVLTDASNRRKIYDWRDPFIFHDHHQTFLVTGGHLARERQAAVNIYEAENPELTQWRHRGVLFAHPDAGAATVECPNFFQLGKQWVLFVSPYGQVQYFIGSFDATTCRFQAHTRGIVDYGASFYAPNTMQVPDGRRLVWGWLNGFPGGRGWNGCLSLPRELKVSPAGELEQSPAPQLAKLRGPQVAWHRLPLAAPGQPLALPNTRSLEIRIVIDLPPARQVALKLAGAGGGAAIAIGYAGAELSVQDSKAPLLLAPGQSKLTLRIFIDRSVLEVFANDTVCVTKIIPLLGESVCVPIVASVTLFLSEDFR